MNKSESRKQRRERQNVEVEESQKKLRDNIAEADRLLTQSDRILKRHRGECEAAED